MSHHVRALIVDLRNLTSSVLFGVLYLTEDVKEECVDVEIEGFVVQKQFRQQTEILAVGLKQSVDSTPQLLVHLVDLAVDFEDRDIAAAVDLVARRLASLAHVELNLRRKRVKAKATYHVDLISLEILHVIKAVLANVEPLRRRELRRIWREVPRVDLVSAELDHLDVLYLRPLSENQ